MNIQAFYIYDGNVSRLTDMMRGSFVFDNFDDLYRGFSVIEGVWSESGGILRVKDRFVMDHAPFGYRHLLINVYAPNSKIVCELQLHHIDMHHVSLLSLYF